MKFVNQTIYVALYIIVIIMVDREQVEGKLDLLSRITFVQKASVEIAIANLFKNFLNKIKFDQKLKQDQQLELKRNEIFRQRLLSRVSGAILKDFYNRF